MSKIVSIVVLPWNIRLAIAREKPSIPQDVSSTVVVVFQVMNGDRPMVARMSRFGRWGDTMSESKAASRRLQESHRETTSRVLFAVSVNLIATWMIGSRIIGVSCHHSDEWVGSCLDVTTAIGFETRLGIYCNPCLITLLVGLCYAMSTAMGCIVFVIRRDVLHLATITNNDWCVVSCLWWSEFDRHQNTDGMMNSRHIISICYCLQRLTPVIIVFQMMSDMLNGERDLEDVFPTTVIAEVRLCPYLGSQKAANQCV